LINPAAPATASNIQFAADSGDFNADGDNFDYPNVSSYSQPTDRESYKSGKGIFPHCSGGNLNNCGPFSLPTTGSQGNEKRNQFQNPGFAQSDVALRKRTAITERLQMELRADFINAFNRPNLNNVDANAQDGANFGTTSSTLTPRNIVLGAKLSF
jgi:hypothetical protein